MRKNKNKKEREREKTHKINMVEPYKPTSKAKTLLMVISLL